MKTKLAIITFGEDSRRFFVEPEKIEKATFGDFSAGGWTNDNMGIEYVGENEDYEDLYESVTGDDFEGQKTWEEIEDIETDWNVVSYWDGNNWQHDVFEYYDVQEIEIEELEPSSPAYCFHYILTLENGEKVNCSTSNESGHLSPYFCEDID